ncbi:MAG: hypothetical protein EBY16_00635 [Gammaproteobacteria bacterium]|nr:hypothetical protein [Gammaproteobacteria bacterium]
MHIQLNERKAPRYISINKVTNKVHLLVPVVGGQDISTDNTCQSMSELNKFFLDKHALRELEDYQNALALDIAVFKQGDERRVVKEYRLNQIIAYIDAVKEITEKIRFNRFYYPEPIKALMRKPSNLHGIQLRPKDQDPVVNVVNPVFSILRTNDPLGNPLSALYNTMHAEFLKVTPARLEPSAQLKQAVLSVLPENAPFADIQRTLKEQCLILFRLNINFTRGNDGKIIEQGELNVLMSGNYEEALTLEEYIDVLLGACAINLSESIPTPPFYSISAVDRTEPLSILTQFFLGIVNVHCKARSISDKNFGEILDQSLDLSCQLVDVVAGALPKGGVVEEQIYDFFNTKMSEFGLTRSLEAEDRAAITQKFETTYRTVTGTAENRHMDEFVIFDRGTLGETAKFVLHQGSICTNFAEIVPDNLANQDFFENIREDFKGHPAEIPHYNEGVSGFIDIDLQALTDEEVETLPDWLRVKCLADPAFQSRQFFNDVAKGRQDKAQTLLTASSPDRKQVLLKTPGEFTDYSGRTFNCTAYEYAYWAKDTHMCMMLNKHMDETTKAAMRIRINDMAHNGLKYTQDNVDYKNPHYDMSFALRNLSLHDFRQLQTMVGNIVGQNLDKIKNASEDNYKTLAFTATEYEQLKKELLDPSVWNWMLSCLGSFQCLGYLTYPAFFMASFFITSSAKSISTQLKFDFNSLITALGTYIDYTTYEQQQRKDANDYTTYEQQRKEAWFNVGKAQRNVPAHIAHKYCSYNRDPVCDGFTFTFKGNVISWFPLASSGLGFDFSVLVADKPDKFFPTEGSSSAHTLPGIVWDHHHLGIRAHYSYSAAIEFDQYFNRNCTQLRKNLEPIASELNLGARLSL